MRTISHSLLVHVQVLKSSIHFVLMYTEDHSLPVLTIKDLINERTGPAMPFELATGTKPSILYLRVLFCSCVVRKATEHVWTKGLNMWYK